LIVVDFFTLCPEDAGGDGGMSPGGADGVSDGSLDKYPRLPISKCKGYGAGEFRSGIERAPGGPPCASRL
jgi:hypothetical protein